MIRVRKSADRGHVDHGWLKATHSFSFASYMDPQHMGFRVLRVLNEDYVAPASGFGTHPHQDMEILTWVLEGGIHHRDSMGEDGTIRPGEMQRMTAGTGVTHSEENDSRSEQVHLLQIWILPERRGLKPGYEQKAFPLEERQGRLRLVASRDGREGSLTIHQDATVHITNLDPGEAVDHALGRGRHVWLQIARGSVQVTVGEEVLDLDAGDGLAVSEEHSVRIEGTSGGSETLLFDLP